MMLVDPVLRSQNVICLRATYHLTFALWLTICGEWDVLSASHNVEQTGRSHECRMALENNSWKVAGAVDLVSPATITS